MVPIHRRAYSNSPHSPPHFVHQSTPPLRHNQLIRGGRGWQLNEVDYFPASKLSLTLKLSEVINMKRLPIISLHYQANR